MTETSLIVQWLTRDLGRISTVAKGARRAKSPFAGKLDLFYAADFTFLPSRRSELHTLVEVGVRERHLHLRTDPFSLQQACYFVQLLELTTEPNTPLPGLLQLVTQAVAALAAWAAPELVVLAFEARLLGELGLDPATPRRSLSPEAGEILQRLGQFDAADRPVVPSDPAATAELTAYLGRTLTGHFGKVPPGRGRALDQAGSWLPRS